MRFEVGGRSWTAVIAGTALAFGLGSAALAADTAPGTASGAGKTKDDYYTRRAKAVLAAEGATAETPHPLTASYPGQEVVVCEAGCPEGRGAYVVSARSEAEVAAAREAVMVPTSATDGGASPAAAGETALVACVAGCYGDSDAEFEAVPEPDADERAAASATTTVVAPPAPALRPVRDKFSPIR